jgi:hypothetical protein
MAGVKLDGAGIQKMKTLDEAVLQTQRLHGIIEHYALALKRKQPTMNFGMQIKRSLPPLVTLLKGQFGMISDQVAALHLVVSRGSNETTRVRVLREGIGSLRQALDIAMVRVKENHAEKEEEEV